jgi:hypothetical protein
MIRRDDVREVIEGDRRIVYRATKTAVDVLTVFEDHSLLPEGVAGGLPKDEDPRPEPPINPRRRSPG